MLWKCWWLSFARRSQKSAEAGFSAGGCVFMQDLSLGSFVDLLINGLQLGFGLGQILLSNQRQEFLDRFSKIGLDIQIMQMMLAIGA